MINNNFDYFTPRELESDQKNLVDGSQQVTSSFSNIRYGEKLRSENKKLNFEIDIEIKNLNQRDNQAVEEEDLNNNLGNIGNSLLRSDFGKVVDSAQQSEKASACIVKKPKNKALLYLSIFKNVSYFLSRFQRSRRICHPQRLSKTQLSLIADSAAQVFDDGFGMSDELVHEKYKTLLSKKTGQIGVIKAVDYNSAFNRIQRAFVKCLPKYLPTSTFFITMQAIVFLFSLIAVAYHPFELAYLSIEIQQSDQKLDLQRLYFYLFIFNAWIQMNACYFQYGTLVTDRRRIFTKYCQSDLFADILLIIFLFIEKTYYRAIANFIRTVLFLWRVMFRNEFVTNIVDRVATTEELQAIKNIFILFLKIIFICHISACYFYLLGQRSLAEEGRSWVQTIPRNDDVTLFSQYINSFYFIVITMSTIGYGDIYPITAREQLFMIFMSFFASGLFGYMINSLGTIFVQMDKKQLNCKIKLDEITLYMNNHGVDDNLKMRAKKYVQFVQQESLDINGSPGKCLLSLSPYLRDEIKINIGVRYLNQVPFIKKNFSSSFLEMLSLKMRQAVHPPDDIVLKFNTKSDPKLYLISKGQVELFFQTGTKYDESQIKIASEFAEEQCFGQFEFFSGNLDPKICVRTKGITKLFYVELSDFLSVVEDYPLDKQKYYELRNEVSLQGNLRKIQLSCFSCLSPNHLVSDCPTLGYSSKQFKIVTDNINLDNEKYRKRFKRQKNQNQFRTLLKLEMLHDRLDSFRMQRLEELIAYENAYIDDDDCSDNEEEHIQAPTVQLANSDCNNPSVIQEEDEKTDQMSLSPQHSNNSSFNNSPSFSSAISPIINPNNNSSSSNNTNQLNNGPNANPNINLNGNFSLTPLAVPNQKSKRGSNGGQGSYDIDEQQEIRQPRKISSNSNASNSLRENNSEHSRTNNSNNNNNNNNILSAQHQKPKKKDPIEALVSQLGQSLPAEDLKSNYTSTHPKNLNPNILASNGQYINSNSINSFMHPKNNNSTPPDDSSSATPQRLIDNSNLQFDQNLLNSPHPNGYHTIQNNNQNKMDTTNIVYDGSELVFDKVKNFTNFYRRGNLHYIIKNQLTIKKPGEKPQISPDRAQNKSPGQKKGVQSRESRKSVLIQLVDQQNSVNLNSLALSRISSSDQNNINIST